MSLSAPAPSAKGFYRVTEDFYIDPSWADVKPFRVIPFAFDSTKTSVQNGASLRTALLALIPGDQLEISPGTYSISAFTDLNINGTAQNPIRIVAGIAGGVIITRPDADQNVLTIGGGAGASFIAMRGLEVTGGYGGLRLSTCNNIWIDRCKIHHTGGSAIQANSHPASKLHFTRNEISDTGVGDEGAGIYIGGASTITKESVIALNRISRASGFSLGYGIFIRDGSWGNLVAGNIVEDCDLPGIIIQGTGGNPVNVVENNACLLGDDYGLQVLKDCIIRNNLVFGGQFGAFSSTPILNQNPSNLKVVHNTFISTGHAVRLGSWAGGTGNVFANNACYSQGQNAVFLSGSAGTTLL